MRRLKGVTKVTGKEVDNYKPVNTADSDTPNKECPIIMVIGYGVIQT